MIFAKLLVSTYSYPHLLNPNRSLENDKELFLMTDLGLLAFRIHVWTGSDCTFIKVFVRISPPCNKGKNMSLRLII